MTWQQDAYNFVLHQTVEDLYLYLYLAKVWHPREWVVKLIHTLAYLLFLCFKKICVGSYEEIHDYLLHQYHVADFWKYLSLLNLWCFMLCVDECSNCTSEIIQLKEWKTWIDYMAATFGSFSEAVIGKNWVWKIFARCAARWQEFFWIELIMWRYSR